MLIRMVAYTVASKLIGNMIILESLTSQCQSTSQTTYMNASNQNLKVTNIHHTNLNDQVMEQQQNGPRNKLH